MMRHLWVAGLAVAAVLAQKKTADVDLNPGPNHKVNAFKLKDGTLVGCNEFMKTRALPGLPANMKVMPPPGKGQFHWEPPIGGEEGSFVVTMVGQPLTSDKKFLKACTTTHDYSDPAVGYWTLSWKGAGGTDRQANGSYRLDSRGGMQNFRDVIVTFWGSTDVVRYYRTKDGYGDAWVVEGSDALDQIRGRNSRIKSIEVRHVKGDPMRVGFAERNSRSAPKASFQILHDH